MIISLVPKEDIHQVLYVVEPMLAEALKYTHGRYDIATTLNELMSGKQTLWVAIDKATIVGCFTVRIVDYPGRRAVNVESLGGKDVKSWLKESFDTISKYALECGCDVFEFNGRSGWEPFAKEYGFQKYAIRMQLDLGVEQ